MADRPQTPVVTDRGSWLAGWRAGVLFGVWLAFVPSGASRSRTHG